MSIRLTFLGQYYVKSVSYLTRRPMTKEANNLRQAPSKKERHRSDKYSGKKEAAPVPNCLTALEPVRS